MGARLEAVAFDVLETLLDLEPLRDRFRDIGQSGELVDVWFMRLQRDSMALSLSGDAADFRAVARQALRTDTRHTATDAEIEHVLDGFAELPAHPDAGPALRELSAAGLRIGCLTVGELETTRRFLAGAGLADPVDVVVTAEQTGIWKPAPQIYRTAAASLGTIPQRLAVVAVHAWDCHGAHRAGCRSAWCSRLELHPGDVFHPPDVRADDLTTLARNLLELA